MTLALDISRCKGVKHDETCPLRHACQRHTDLIDAPAGAVVWTVDWICADEWFSRRILPVEKAVV